MTAPSPAMFKATKRGVNTDTPVLHSQTLWHCHASTTGKSSRKPRLINTMPERAQTGR